MTNKMSKIGIRTPLDEIEIHQQNSLRRNKSLSSSIRNIFTRHSKKHKAKTALPSALPEQSEYVMDQLDCFPKPRSVGNTTDDSNCLTYRSKNVLTTYTPQKSPFQDIIAKLEQDSKNEKSEKSQSYNPFAIDKPQTYYEEEIQKDNPFDLPQVEHPMSFKGSYPFNVGSASIVDSPQEEINFLNIAEEIDLEPPTSPPTWHRRHSLRRWLSSRSSRKSINVEVTEDLDPPDTPSPDQAENCSLYLSDRSCTPSVTSPLKESPYDESSAFTARYLIKAGLVNKDDQEYSKIITELDKKKLYDQSISSRPSTNHSISKKKNKKLKGKRSLGSLRSLFSRPEDQPVLVKDPMPHFNLRLVNFNDPLQQIANLNPYHNLRQQINLTPAYISLQRLYRMNGLDDTQMESEIFARIKKAEDKRVAKLIEKAEKESAKELKVTKDEDKNVFVDDEDEENDEIIQEMVMQKNYSTLWNIWFDDASTGNIDVIYKVWSSRQLNTLYVNSYEYVDQRTSVGNSKVMMLKYGIQGRIRKDQLARNGSLLTFYIRSRDRFEVWKRFLQIILEDKLMVTNIGQYILGLGWKRNPYTIYDTDDFLLDLYLGCVEPKVQDVKLLLCELVLLMNDKQRPCVTRCSCYNMSNDTNFTVSVV